MKTYTFNIKIELIAKSRYHAWFRIYRFIQKMRLLDNIDFKEIPERENKESVV